MINRLHILVLVAWLVALVAGCGGMHHYDGRLTAADSLMMPYPDSALALVTAIPDSALTTEGDRAYRDLLMTQARYKCYVEITASDDSAICRAMDYYRRHDGERDKLTRAYLYKGAVMEELGHVDSAMFYYKTAEAAADEKDYANLGQINTRIAALYRLYYADTQICYDKYSKALDCYRHTGDKPKQLICLFNMAGLSGVTGTDDPEQLLLQTIHLAEELNDSVYLFKCLEMRCRQLIYNNTDTSLYQAKGIAHNCLANFKKYINNDLLLDLAQIYVRFHNPDSAKFYLKYVDEKTGSDHIGQIRTRKNLLLSKIADLEGDLYMAGWYNQIAHQIADSMSNNEQKYHIQQIEGFTNDISIEKRKHTIAALKWLVICLAIAAAVILLDFVFFHYRKMKYIKSIMHELQHTGVNDHTDLLEKLDSKDVVLQQFVKNMVTFMQTSIDTSENDSPSVIRQRIKSGISDLTANEDFWNALRSYLDKNHNNIITKIAQNPTIKNKDLQFIELCCCGFSNVEIAIVMDYAPKYVSSKRGILAQKLGTDQPLQDYLNHLMSEDG